MFSILEDNNCAIRLGRVTWLLVLCALWPSQALGQHTHSHNSPAPGSAQERQARAAGRPGVIKTQTARLEIPDTELLDQNGTRVRFYSDLIKGKVVVLNFFFTRCANVCLGQGITLKNFKARLGERFGKEVFFVSISKDPADTPARMKRWGVHFGVSPGWTLATGEQGAINKLSLDLTAEEADSATHSPLLIIGNDRTGIWTLASGDSTADELIAVIDEVTNPAAASGK